MRRSGWLLRGTTFYLQVSQVQLLKVRRDLTTLEPNSIAWPLESRWLNRSVPSLQTQGIHLQFSLASCFSVQTWFFSQIFVTLSQRVSWVSKRMCSSRNFRWLRHLLACREIFWTSFQSIGHGQLLCAPFSTFKIFGFNFRWNEKCSQDEKRVTATQLSIVFAPVSLQWFLR